MKMQMAWSRPLAFRQILADIQNAACAQQHTAAAEFYFKQQHFSSGPVSFLRRRQSPSFFFYVCILPLSFFFIFFFYISGRCSLVLLRKMNTPTKATNRVDMYIFNPHLCIRKLKRANE